MADREAARRLARLERLREVVTLLAARERADLAMLAEGVEDCGRKESRAIEAYGKMQPGSPLAPMLIAGHLSRCIQRKQQAMPQLEVLAEKCSAGMMRQQVVERRTEKARQDRNRSDAARALDAVLELAIRKSAARLKD